MPGTQLSWFPGSEQIVGKNSVPGISDETEHEIIVGYLRRYDLVFGSTYAFIGFGTRLNPTIAWVKYPGIPGWSFVSGQLPSQAQSRLDAGTAGFRKMQKNITVLVIDDQIPIPLVSLVREFIAESLYGFCLFFADKIDRSIIVVVAVMNFLYTSAFFVG